MRHFKMSIALTAFFAAVWLAVSAGAGLAHASGVIEVIAGSGEEGDAKLIKDVLMNCQPGCTVELYGHFHVDQSIKVTGFSGHIKGQGKEATIVEAVGPFGPIPVPLAGNALLGVLLWLDAPTGDITIEDVTFEVNNPAPLRPHPNPFIGADDSTALNNLLVITGPPNCSGCETTKFVIRDVAMRGAMSDDLGSLRGQNVVYCGIVAPLWTGPVDTTVEDSDFAHCGDTAYESFSYSEGNSLFRDNTVSNSHIGIWMAWNSPDITTTIKDNAFVDVAFPIECVNDQCGTVIEEDNEFE